MSSIIRGHTEAETAEILHVKVETLAAWRSRGVGPKYRKIGKVIDYPDEFIREYQDSCIRTPEPAPIRRQRRALAAEAASASS
jgi:hypothetical protein